MTAPKTDGVPKDRAANSLRIDAQPNVDEKVALARAALRPSVRAAVTTQTFAKQFGELDLTALVDELATQAKVANNGDLQRVEAMLVSQAHTLEAIFHEMARRAALNMGEYINAAETYMRLALKAQSQCRATIETLALVKNPQPVTFVHQANLAHGPQQVNNVPKGVGGRPSRAGDSENPQNKLLEQQNGEGLDLRTVQTAIRDNSTLATVEKVHGTENTVGQAARISQRV